MTLQNFDILIKVIVFVFAISVHESAHAWMANLRGDPTARMLGRITLNPLKHIDPVGTIVLPVIALYYQVPILGWAKPTPVDPRNFKNHVLDDILTSVVGPVSNFVIATGALVVLVAISHSSDLGRSMIDTIANRSVYQDHLEILANQSNSFLMPAILITYELMFINIILGVFNLIPVPPLDGSHVLRHFLPEAVRRAYDTMGWIALLALVYFGGNFLGRLIYPVVDLFNSVLTRN
ncbi:MAG: site-2 protease family protein [Acidobacteriia bacterium]|nr:site-2 protease family protein [Terriglobia bacterium]